MKNKGCSYNCYYHNYCYYCYTVGIQEMLNTHSVVVNHSDVVPRCCQLCLLSCLKSLLFRGREVPCTSIEQ